MTEDSHVRANRAQWNQRSDDYQRRNASQIREQAFTGELAWGTWAIPESQLGVLVDVAGKDVLELGCGGAQWSTALARRGAAPVGLDLSERQLEHARLLMDETGVGFALVQGNAEQVPFADASFDIVFADHGAFSFADPYSTVPESARVLRPGGLLVFSHTSPLCEIASPLGAGPIVSQLLHDYFGLHRIERPGGTVEFNLPYGAWIRLFRACGLVVEDLIEPQPGSDAVSTYRGPKDFAWSRRWPSECIWKARKA
jgi:ubiquinone/menaquinone biosynthesis C-methylase UbiE